MGLCNLHIQTLKIWLILFNNCISIDFNNLLNKSLEFLFSVLISSVVAFLIFITKLTYNRLQAKSAIELELKDTMHYLNVEENVEKLISNSYIKYNPLSTHSWELYKNDGILGLSKKQKRHYLKMYSYLEDINRLSNIKADLILLDNQISSNLEDINLGIKELISKLKELYQEK